MKQLSISFCFLALVFSGCKDRTPPPQSNLQVIDAKIGKRLYRLEVADTPATMEHGLMDRTSMPGDHGMIFVFPREQPLTFWMKNTLIPLDILFVDSTGQVLTVAHMKPAPPNLPDDQIPVTRSDGPAKYAIELNEGAAVECQVHAGDKIILGPTTPPPAN